MRLVPIVCFLLLCGITTQVQSQSYVFAQLTGSPVNTNGWNMQGYARVGNSTVGTGNSEILLAPNYTFQSGAIFCTEPINLAICKKWFAEFDMRMFDGNGADGIAFCFLDVPPVGFQYGLGLGIPATANGLKVCFDTYNNCGTPAPKIEIRWGAGYDGECSTTQPTLDNTNGKLSFLRSNSYNHVRVEYDQGNIKVLINGTLYISAFQQFNFSGYLGFTAATGAWTDQHSIKNVIIYTEAPPSDAGPDLSVCPGGTVQLGIPPNPGYLYTWTAAPGLSATNISNPMATGFQNSDSVPSKMVYYLKTEFATSAGCPSHDSIVVNVRVKPKVDFAVAAACAPQYLGQITDKTTIGDHTESAFTHLWTFSDGGSSTQRNPVHQFPSDGSYNIKLEVTSAAGCKNDTTKSYTIAPRVKAGFTLSTTQSCMKDTVRINDASITNGNTITQWRYDFGDGTIDSVQNPKHFYTQGGTYTIKQYVISSQSCFSDTATKTITVNALPIADFKASSLQCINQVVNFTDQSTSSLAITKWNWSFGEGSVSPLQNPTNTYTVVNTYNVRLLVENAQGCKSDTVKKTIAINPAPAVSFTLPQVCEGVLGQFLDATPTSGDPATYSYAWNFGDNTTSTQKDPVHLYNVGGNFTVKLDVTSGSGCTGTATKSMTVSGTPQANFSKASNATFCGNGTVVLTEKSTISFGSIDKTIIYWNWPSLTDTTIDVAPTAGKQYGHQYASFSNPPTFKYVIKWVSATNGGCFTEKIDSVLLMASPQLEISSVPNFCVNSDSFLISASETRGLSGIGAFSGFGIKPTGVFNPSIAGAGNHKITYSYMLTNGCIDSISKIISVGALPVISAGVDKYLSVGGSVTIDASGSSGLSYKWTPSTGLNYDTVLKPVASPAAETLYTLHATSALGCTASDDVLVRLRKAPVVPNAFSPNGDGINDKWELGHLIEYPGCVVEIFNRYGQRVFISVGYSEAWDGKINGQPLPIGVYYYLINPKNGLKQVTGSVTLLR